MPRWTEEHWDAIIESQYKVVDPNNLEEYKPTRADHIRANDDLFMSVQIAGCIVSYLVQSKMLIGTEADHKDLISGISDDILKWLQSEAEEPHD